MLYVVSVVVGQSEPSLRMLFYVIYDIQLINFN